jgi:WD40 repeat protein
MLPANFNTNKNVQISGKESFNESLCKGYRFEVGDLTKCSGSRALYYYKTEHSLLLSHFFTSRVHILNLETGKLRWFDHHGTTVRSVLVCNNEIITTSWDGSVCVTNFDSLETRLILTEKIMGRCPYAAISPDYKFVYSYSYDSDKNPFLTSNTVREWDLTDGKLIKTIQLSGVHVTSRRCGYCAVQDKRLFVVSNTGFFQIFDRDTGILLAEDNYNEQLQSLCLLPAFNLLALGGSEGNIYLCDLNGRRILRKIKGHSQDISELMIHPDKPDILITISFAGTMNIWKLPGLELLASADVDKDRLWNVTVVNDLIITGGDSVETWIYDIKNLQDIKLKAKLFISDDSYALMPTELSSFYTNNLSLVHVKRNDDGTLLKDQFAEYLLNTACNLKILKDMFCPESNELLKLRTNSKGLYQITQ